MTFDLVVPTSGRESLRLLLHALERCRGPRPEAVILADDRPDKSLPLLEPLPGGWVGERLRIVPAPGSGPAAARNRGWQAGKAEWVAFLDDDVLPGHRWLEELAADLGELPRSTAASQGRIHVPLPLWRRPTDWERNVAGLEGAVWATADMAYRRSVLERLGGFDERFPRAYREDADLGLRTLELGYRIEKGRRVCVHPVPKAGPWVSLQKQAGNADDVLMARLHGPAWRELAGAPAGRRGRHLLTAAAALLAVAGFLTRERKIAWLGVAGWVAGTAELAWARIAPGPRTPAEAGLMLATSAAIPALASYHWLRAVLLPLPPEPPLAVLFDRDGTLIEDVPYNADPERVRPLPGAREVLDRLRAGGVRIGVVSNQSAIARGLASAEEVESVNRRVEEMLGPIDAWGVCPHGPDDGCACRKPEPGLVREAARTLGVPVERCAVVGDIGADVEAARRAGARGVLVPNRVTRKEEVQDAREVARDLRSAIERLFGRAG